MRRFLESPALNGIGVLVAIVVAFLGDSQWSGWDFRSCLRRQGG